jgi:predicted RNase H-like HicB family nuclease
MKYKVLLVESEEGFAVNCPALPGCWSQGATRAEALENVREAIRLWLEVAEEDLRKEVSDQNVEAEEVTV